MNGFRFSVMMLLLTLVWQPVIFAEDTLSDRDSAKFGLAQSLMNVSDYQQAEELLGELHRKYPKNKDITLNLAGCLGYGKKLKASMDLLDKLEMEFPDDPAIKNTYVSILEANQKFPDAIARYSAMLQGDPENQKLLIKIAELNAWTGNYDVAKKEYLSLIEKNPDHKEAVLGLADVYFWSRDYTNAIKMYQRAALLPEEDPKRCQNLAKAYALAGMPDKALEMYEKLSTLSPQDIKISIAKISVLYDLGRNEAAEKEKEGLFARSGQDVKVKTEIAEVLALRHRYAEALGILKEVTEADPGNKDARLYLARVYSWDTQYGRSIAEYEKLIKDFPDWVTPRREKGRGLGWSRKYKKAIGAYKSIFRDIGPDENARLEMDAKKDFYRGYDYSAIKEYKKWLEAETDDEEALYDLGQAYSRQMQWTNAQNTYARLLRILPDHFRAKQALDKVNIYSGSPSIEAGYEYYKAHSGARDTDEKYHNIRSGVRYPVRKDLCAGITEETFLYSSELFSQVTRQVIAVALEYYLKPLFWAKAGYSYNIYSRRIKDSNNFNGELNFKPFGMVTSTFSYDRENISDNGETIMRGLHRDNYRTRLELAPNRRITTGGDFTFSRYSDSNKRGAYGFDVKGTLFYEPKRVSVFYRFEDYGFKKPSDYYFAPSSFHTNQVGMEWQQHLNSEELFWGINETYFTARYSINFDVNNQVGHKLFFNFHRDWTNRFSTHCEWSKMIYQQRETYSEDRVSVYLKLDF